jgi:hypothetical protein
MVFIGILAPVTMAFAAYRRKVILEGYYKEQMEPLTEARFARFLRLCEGMKLSIMTNSYAMFRAPYVVIGPLLQQFLRLAVTLCCVLLETNSTEQLVVTASCELLNALFVIACKPFHSSILQQLSTVGSFHLVGLIVLSSYYRAALLDGNAESQRVLAGFMITLSVCFILFVLYTFWRLGLPEVVQKKFQTLKASLKPVIYTFRYTTNSPTNEDTPVFIVGKRKTCYLPGYTCRHGQRVTRTEDDVQGTVVGLHPGAHDLYWIPDGNDIVSLCAETNARFQQSYVCQQLCATLPGVYEKRATK